MQAATFKLYEANKVMNLNLVKDGKESKPKRLLVAASGTGFGKGWAKHLSSGLNSSCSITDPCVNTTRSASNCWWLRPDVASDCAAFVGLTLTTPPSKQSPSLSEASVMFRASKITPGAYNFALHVPLNNGIRSIRPNISVALEVRGRVCANKSDISILPGMASVYSHMEQARKHQTCGSVSQVVKGQRTSSLFERMRSRNGVQRSWTSTSQSKQGHGSCNTPPQASSASQGTYLE